MRRLWKKMRGWGDKGIRISGKTKKKQEMKSLDIMFWDS